MEKVSSDTIVSYYTDGQWLQQWGWGFETFIRLYMNTLIKKNNILKIRKELGRSLEIVYPIWKSCPFYTSIFCHIIKGWNQVIFTNLPSSTVSLKKPGFIETTYTTTYKSKIKTRCNGRKFTRLCTYSVRPYMPVPHLILLITWFLEGHGSVRIDGS